MGVYLFFASSATKLHFFLGVFLHFITGDDSPSGFYIYIGPNIKKHIQTGTIYRGTRANALKQAAEAIKAYPLVKTLIVSGDALPEARLKVKAPGNALYANYMKLKLAGKEGK